MFPALIMKISAPYFFSYAVFPSGAIRSEDFFLSTFPGGNNSFLKFLHLYNLTPHLPFFHQSFRSLLSFYNYRNYYDVIFMLERQSRKWALSSCDLCLIHQIFSSGCWEKPTAFPETVNKKHIVVTFHECSIKLRMSWWEALQYSSG